MLAVSPGLHFGEPYALALALGGLAIFVAVAALSHQGERAFSASLVYLGVGVGVSALMVALELPRLDPFAEPQIYERAAELAVIVALFGTGLKLDKALTIEAWGRVGRLLLIAMPLTIAALTLFGTQVMGLSLGAAIVLAAVLSPTDPVLAGDIGVGPPGDEEEHEPQFSITGEAGLNDGLAFPFVLLGVILAGDEGSGWFTDWLLEDVVYSIAVALVLGAALGYGVASLAVRLRDRRLLSADLDGWLAIAAVLLIYGATELASAYGFVAAFAGGVAFRRYEHGHEYNRRVHHGAETVEKFAELAVILLIGASVTLSGLEAPGWEGWLLVPALLLVFRPLAVMISLAGSRLSWRDRAFMAWFGVRGIGSLYYVAVAIGTGAVAGAEITTVFWTTVACIGVSVVVHGVSSAPLSRRWLPG